LTKQILHIYQEEYLLQDVYVPGIMYHVIGVMGVLCALGSLTLPETKDKNLADKLNKHKVTVDPVTDKIV